MTSENKVTSLNEINSLSYWNWILGSEFLLTLMILSLSGAGYLVLK